MLIRDATIADIPCMQKIRNEVVENALSNPLLIAPEDYEEFIAHRGKGWVCEINNQITGFAIADLQENNIWALFVSPSFEKNGIGKQLHTQMLDWYFQYREKVWLGTAPHTRAEHFYKKAGWKPAGMNGTKEVKFEMTLHDWENVKKNNLPPKI